VLCHEQRVARVLRVERRPASRGVEMDALQPLRSLQRMKDKHASISCDAVPHAGVASVQPLLFVKEISTRQTMYV
jgi:hypothetical protein